MASSDKGTSAASGGVGFCSLLCILFVGLKLTGFIDWPWWLVFLPVWGQIVLVMLLVGGYYLVLYMKDRE